ncbi:Uncharacterised protein [Mycolicibacterium flavescens]|nr:Uncharacterised protein [Mycolicibacterium flavescens]
MHAVIVRKLTRERATVQGYLSADAVTCDTSEQKSAEGRVDKLLEVDSQVAGASGDLSARNSPEPHPSAQVLMVGKELGLSFFRHLT